MPSSTDVDVIVVGAGPAGLACAFALAGAKVRLLERLDRHGGRVHTIDLAHQRIDLGACFAFDPAAVPSGLVVDAGRMVRERSSVCVRLDDRIFAAATPRGCLVQMGLDRETLGAIDAVARLESDAKTLAGTRAYTLLNALLHQIHPGELRDYAPPHQRDGLLSWHPDHWEGGNGPLTDALLARSGAQLQVGTEVTRVIDRGDRVVVEFLCHGMKGRVSARAAVIASTADVAASLVAWQDPHLRRLLAATRYAAYLVVALAGPARPSLPDFRCLVSPGEPPAVVVQQRNVERDGAVLLSYYQGQNLASLGPLTDVDLIDLSRSRLVALGIDAAAMDALGDATVARWASAGTILSHDYLKARSSNETRGHGNIILAGDYACGDGGVGYGLSDAIRSGLQAARQVHALLAR